MCCFLDVGGWERFIVRDIRCLRTQHVHTISMDILVTWFGYHLQVSISRYYSKPYMIIIHLAGWVIQWKGVNKTILDSFLCSLLMHQQLEQHHHQSTFVFSARGFIFFLHLLFSVILGMTGVDLWAFLGKIILNHTIRDLPFLLSISWCCWWDSGIFGENCLDGWGVISLIAERRFRYDLLGSYLNIFVTDFG